MQPGGDNNCVYPACPPGLRFREGVGCVYPDGMPCALNDCGGLSNRGPEPARPAPRIDIELAKQRLKRVDLSTCEGTPGPKGEGWAVVSFKHNGSVDGVELSPPFEGSTRATCIAWRLSQVTIPEFRGNVNQVGLPFSLSQ
jgi:hypothetical protein